MEDGWDCFMSLLHDPVSNKVAVSTAMKQALLKDLEHMNV